MKPMTTSDKLRRDVQKIAKRNLSGETLNDIAAGYGCGRSLLIRIMQQELDENFWAEKARRRARISKAKEDGALARAAGKPRAKAKK